MLICPQCGTPVRLGSVAPERAEVAARGAAFAKWKQSQCRKCQAVLEVVPWTQFLGLAICILIFIAGPAALLALATKLFPENAFLLYMNLPRNAPSRNVPANFVLLRLFLKILFLPWMIVVFGFLLPRMIRLRVSYDPQEPLSIR